MSEMKRYSSYKDSGVVWIGEIPRGWETNKLKFVSKHNELTLSNNTDPNYELEYIEISDVDSSGNILNRTSYRFEDSPSRCRRVLRKGDVFISTVRTYLKSIGYVSHEVEDLVCSTGFCVLTPTKDVKSDYLFYMLGTEWFISSVISTSDGVSYPSIQSEKLVSLNVILPPLSEQHQIVSYLDDKTTKIDSLIQSKQKKITLLKEKRTSLINHVVTKGLNPNVEMKDSGVEWIGEIPSHWKRKRIKHITDSLNGYSFKSGDFDKEYDVPVIRIGDVSDSIDFSECVKVKSHFLVEKEDFIIRRNDILIGLTGGTIGKSGRYNYDFPSLLNQRVGLLRNRDLVLNNLLYHYVKSDIFIRYIYYECYGGGQDNISMGDILDMVFPLPPLSEQHQIVQYLDNETSSIDKTISLEERKIELLKEYKQSLISDVVTGKICVLEDE